MEVFEQWQQDSKKWSGSSYWWIPSVSLKHFVFLFFSLSSFSSRPSLALLHDSGPCCDLGTICLDGSSINELISITLKHSHQTLFSMVRLFSKYPSFNVSQCQVFTFPSALCQTEPSGLYKYKIWLTFSCLISASQWIYRPGIQQCGLPF